MAEYNYDAATTRSNRYPRIKKLGVCSPNGEMTPFVWKGQLMRLELDDPLNGTDSTVLRQAIIRNCESGEVLSRFAEDSYFHSGYLEGDTFYVLGVDMCHRPIRFLQTCLWFLCGFVQIFVSLLTFPW